MIMESTVGRILNCYAVDEMQLFEIVRKPLPLQNSEQATCLNMSDHIKIFVSLVAIVNRYGAMPIFISITADETVLQRRKTAYQVAVGIIIILLVALLFGE